MTRKGVRFCVDCRTVKPLSMFGSSLTRCLDCERAAGERACPGCGETKPLAAFGPARGAAMPRCLACEAPAIEVPPTPVSAAPSPVAAARDAARLRVEDRPNLSVRDAPPSRPPQGTPFVFHTADTAACLHYVFRQLEERARG
jgi:hypothetical protein